MDRSKRTRVILVAVVGAIAVLAGAGPSAADWQGTRWGMTRAEVIQAASATAVAGSPGDQVYDADLGAQGRYAALGFSFASRFYFDRAGGLKVVKLVLDDVDRCADLRTAMSGIYGRPVEERAMSTAWLDARNGDEVRFSDVRVSPVIDECFVIYRPGLAAGTEGL